MDGWLMNRTNVITQERISKGSTVRLKDTVNVLVDAVVVSLASSHVKL